MPFEQHLEKTYTQDARSVYEAALRATAKLDGKLVTAAAEKGFIEAKFPKTILGKLLGERTYLSCAVKAQETGCQVVIDAYPLDAVERKLMFGARKGVTETVVTWFAAHLEHQMTAGQG